MEEQMAQAAAQAGGLINQAFGLVILMTSLRTAFEMGLLDIIPDTGDMSLDEVARASGAQAELIGRLLRPLTGSGILQEVQPGRYRHNPMSLALKSPELRGYMQTGWDLWLPVYGSLHSWFKDHNFQLSDDPSDTPFATVYKGPLFSYLAKNPPQAAVFNASMEHLAYPIATLFPFSDRLGQSQASSGVQGKLIDVGGGKGQASREILGVAAGYANRIVVQDQESVLAELPEDLKAQVETMAYNFFEPQPLKGAMFYYLRNILCDWPDAKCVEILRNQADAMSSTSRLLIATRLMPEINTDPMSAAMDICMLTYGGAERTAKQFDSMLGQAGLVVERIWQTEGSPWGVIESKLA